MVKSAADYLRAAIHEIEKAQRARDSTEVRYFDLVNEIERIERVIEKITGKERQCRLVLPEDNR